jgi:hypothetical protein
MSSGPHRNARQPHHTAAEHYVALSRESAPHRWLLAVLVGGAIGLCGGLVLPWPLTLLASAVTVAALLIWDHHHGAIASWWPGDHRPHRLAATAARLERHRWTALPNPQHEGLLADYLLIGPGGVFVVDHQVWPKSDIVTTDHATGLLMVGGKPAARRVASIKGAAAGVAHELSHWLPDETAVHPVVTVDGLTLDHPQLVAAVTILPITDLARFLHDRDPVLYPTGITTLTEHARHLFTKC